MIDYVVILKLGQGNWQQGFPVVTVQLFHRATLRTGLQSIGSLPPTPHLAQLWQQWRSLYHALAQRLQPRRSLGGIDIEPDGVTNVSAAAFSTLCQQLKQHFNQWLAIDSFSNAEQQLRTRLSTADPIYIIVETDDPQLRQFPWHLWNFLDAYPRAEIALSPIEYAQVPNPPSSTRRQPRILAVLGNSNGIDIDHDRRMLAQLPETDTIFLVEPSRQALDQWLWDETGWDLLFFAGHSTSQGADLGAIAINPTESLTIPQLRNALRAAIARGLRLAIFNSCDGLGLARALADLHLPQMIVMREPVPDPVAQAFLRHLLDAWQAGYPFPQAMREAREKLQGLESAYPCASWLPVLYQNPAEVESGIWPGLNHPQRLPLTNPPSSIRDRTAPQPIAPVSTVPTVPVPPRSPWYPVQVSAIAALAVTLVVMGVRFAGLFQGIELQLFDYLLRLRPPEPPDPRILVVEVTQDDSDRYGYPLDDATLAQLLAILQQGNPRAIGVDMHRYQPRGQGRHQLISQFQRHSNLFIVCWFSSSDRNYAPPPEFSPQQSLQQVGFSDLLVDGKVTGDQTSRPDLGAYQTILPGDVVRRQLLSYNPRLATAPSSCATPYSLSFQLAFRFLYAAEVRPLQVTPQNNWQFGPVVLHRLPARLGGYQALDGLSSQILLNYRSGTPGQQVTLDQVLSGKLSPDVVKDRVVLIGVTAPIARDTFSTPYGEMSGVWIHAHMLSQLLSAVLDDRPLIRALPQWQDWQWGDALWVLLWALLGGMAPWRFRPWWAWVGVNAGATLALHQLCLLLLIQGLWVPFIPSTLALWLTSGGLKLYNNLKK